jgi:hypothetical protein
MPYLKKNQQKHVRSFGRSGETTPWKHTRNQPGVSAPKSMATSPRIQSSRWTTAQRTHILCFPLPLFMHAVAVHRSSFKPLSAAQRNSLHQSVVERQRRYNGLVPLAALLELLHVQRAVFVLVHHVEDLLHPLLRGVFIFWQLDHGADLHKYFVSLPSSA